VLLKGMARFLVRRSLSARAASQLASSHIIDHALAKRADVTRTHGKRLSGLKLKPQSQNGASSLSTGYLNVARVGILRSPGDGVPKIIELDLSAIG